MITEDYVSFKTAKLLKEKEFDEPCYAYWHEDENRLIISQSMHAIQNITNPCFFGPAAPTLQMAMKWLREVHNFNVNIELTIHGYFCSLSHIVRDSLGYIIDIEDSEAWETAYYDSYEQACEAAIKFCLENLI